MIHRSIIVCGFVLLAFAQLARGAGFDASIELKNDKSSQTTKAASGKHDAKAHRPAFQGAIDTTYTIQWKVTRSASDEVKDVLVHLYVVQLDRQGQAPPALDPKVVILESALTMDFPKDKVSSGSQQFRVDEPGVYLLRIEAGSDPDKPGVEDFAEVELVVK